MFDFVMKVQKGSLSSISCDNRNNASDSMLEENLGRM